MITPGYLEAAEDLCCRDSRQTKPILFHFYEEAGTVCKRRSNSPFMVREFKQAEFYAIERFPETDLSLEENCDCKVHPNLMLKL